MATGSPADAAGLKVGDQIVSFGGETSTLMNLSGIVSQNENRSVPVTVVRSAARVELSLTPRLWSGRGLLGCYLVPSIFDYGRRLYRPPVGNREP